MASNSCNLTDTTASVIRNFYIASNVVIPSLYLLFGSAISVSAFMFFQRRLKKNEAYGYQLAACCFKLFDIYALSANWYFLYFAGWGPVGGWSRFKSSYTLMWYTCRVGYTFPGIAVNQFIIFPSAIAVDRAFAMTMPITYRTINHKMHLLAASVLTLMASTSIGFDFSMDFDVVVGADGQYSLGYGTANAQTWKRVMVNVRNGVRYTAFAVMIAATIVFLYKYRKRNKVKIGNTTRKQNDSKSDEKALVILSFIQCSIVCLYMAVSTMVNRTRTYFPEFYACQGSLIQYAFALTTQLCGIADYVILFMYNKKFRVMIINKFKRLSTGTTSTALVRSMQ